jgi:hypothetical protein
VEEGLSMHLGWVFVALGIVGLVGMLAHRFAWTVPETIGALALAAAVALIAFNSMQKE